jgi:hypothetical protein
MWLCELPNFGKVITDFVSNVFVNALTPLSAQESAQIGQPDYFGFGPKNVKNGPGRATLSKFQYDRYGALCFTITEARPRGELRQDPVVNEAYGMNVKITYFSM